MDWRPYKNGILLNETLVIADTHLGYTEELQVGNPNKEYNEFITTVKAILSETPTSDVVIAGDVFDTFEYPSDNALNAVRNLRNYIESQNGRLIVTPGNHDSAAIPWDKITSTTHDEYRVNNTAILHGHSPVKAGNVELYVLGHLHPSIRIQGSKWPCYLYGNNRLNDADILILPSFSDFTEGTVISPSHEPAIDFPIESNFSKYKPIIWDRSTKTAREFPALSKLNSYL